MLDKILKLMAIAMYAVYLVLLGSLVWFFIKEERKWHSITIKLDEPGKEPN